MQWLDPGWLPSKKNILSKILYGIKITQISPLSTATVYIVQVARQKTFRGDIPKEDEVCLKMNLLKFYWLKVKTNHQSDFETPQSVTAVVCRLDADSIFWCLICQRRQGSFAFKINKKWWRHFHDVKKALDRKDKTKVNILFQILHWNFQLLRTAVYWSIVRPRLPWTTAMITIRGIHN